MPILECTEVWSVWKRHKEDDAIESWEKQPLCLRLMAVSWYKKKPNAYCSPLFLCGTG